MPIEQDVDREIRVALLKYEGKEVTPETKQEILKEVSDILYFHKMSYLEPVFNDKNGIEIKAKPVSLWEMSSWIYTLIAASFAIIFMIIKPVIAIGFTIMGLFLYMVSKLAKRDLKEIEASKFGMTVKEYEKFMEDVNKKVEKNDKGETNEN